MYLPPELNDWGNLFSKIAEFFYSASIKTELSCGGGCDWPFYLRLLEVVTWTLRWVSCVTSHIIDTTILFIPASRSVPNNPFITQLEWELLVSWNDQPRTAASLPWTPGQCVLNWMEFNRRLLLQQLNVNGLASFSNALQTFSLSTTEFPS